MKVCVYGAGAIGGLMGAHLARIGKDVTLIARGEHLAAMRAKGLSVSGASGDFTVTPRVTDDPAEAGLQNFVIVALKAHQVAAIADRMAPLLGPETVVVMAVNGVPWWYFHGLEGPLAGKRLKSVDPDGRQWDLIGPQRGVDRHLDRVEPGQGEPAEHVIDAVGEQQRHGVLAPHAQAAQAPGDAGGERAQLSVGELRRVVDDRQLGWPAASPPVHDRWDGPLREVDHQPSWDRAGAGASSRTSWVQPKRAIRLAGLSGR